MNKIKLWIDDTRLPPSGYYWIKSVQEFKKVYEDMIHYGTYNTIESISLDHDAGVYEPFGGDYIQILNYLEMMEKTKNYYVNFGINIHSANAVGIANMKAIIKHNNWKEVY